MTRNDISGVESLDEQGDARRRLALGRLAGVLFCTGALLSVPSTLTIDPAPEQWVLAVIALALVAGVACLLIPWGRLPGAWFHLVPVIATVLVTAGAWASNLEGTLHAWLYVMIGIVVGSAFRSRRAVAAHLAFMSLCLAAPVVDPFIASDLKVRNLAVGIPALLIATSLVVHFRERVESGRRAFAALARLDPLTGVGNYRTLYERLDYEIVRHGRHRRHFAVMLLDLDGFKQVNERYGHLEGDRVLKEVGAVLGRTVREQDTVARQGGDEFSVLAPETGREELPVLAGRLRDALAEISIDGRPLTATIGSAFFPDDGEATDDLLTAADDDLRSSKRASQGRMPRASASGRLRSVGGGGAAASAGNAP